MKYLYYSFRSVLFSAISLLIFIALSAIPGIFPIILILLCGAIVFVFSKTSLGLSQLLLISLFSAIGFTIIWQFLGFLFFSGLVKDLIFGSVEHLQSLIILIMALFSFYATCSLLACVFRKRS